MKANSSKRSKLVATVVQFILPYCLRRYRCTNPPKESTTKKSNIQYQDIGKLSDGISGELQNDEV